VRAWARIRRNIQPQRVEIVYSPSYKLRLGGTPIDPQRSEKILGFLFGQGLIGRRTPHTPGRASLKTLSRVHSDRYLDQLNHSSALVPVVGFSPDDDIRENALSAQRSAVGGTIKATRIALQKSKVVVNLGGGFHHARPDTGRGFCIFNDIAIAIREHRELGFAGRILVVDLDLHDGDGTRAVFAHDASVFTFSIHNRNWDDAPAIASESIELQGDVEDDEYLDIVDRRLPDLLRRLEPDLVFFVAGTDPAEDDPLGNWNISEEGMVRRDQLLFSAVEEACGEIPLVVTLAGGYGNSTWRYTALTLSWLLSGRAIAPPSNEALTLERYRRIIGDLEPGTAGRDQSDLADGAWDLSEADIWGDLMGAKRSPRLLGFFSPHGVELVLERSGFLDRLRDIGFPRPTIAFDLNEPAGETVRIFGDEDHDELLVEVRLRRDVRSVPGLSLLSIEWLLMQNPRLSFESPARRLPGQTHPGLGLLHDMMALLIIVCEELELDGISFVPSHYHLARKGGKFLHFLEPADAAWYDAVDDAVSELPLREATRAVESGFVVDEGGKPLSWRPMMMVLPVSEELRGRVEGEAYEASVRAERSSLVFRLTPTE
jgi:acetoin utilization deacetylase AcuC-like enzyme